MQDIIVRVSLDTKPRPVETLMPLLLSLDGAASYKEYADLASLALDFGTATPTYKTAAAMYDQADYAGAVAKFAVLGLASDADAAGVTGALDTLRDTHDDWYYLVPVAASSSIIAALAAWAAATVLSSVALAAGEVESEKLLVCQQDTNTTAITAAQTVLCHNPAAASTNMHAAWVGRMAPHYPRSPTWKWKELQGVSPVDIDGAELTALLGQKINTYVRNHKRNYMRDGTCADGEYIDVVISRWRIKQLLRKAVTDLAVDTDNIPYDDVGFAMIGGAVISALRQAATDGIVSTVDGAPKITVNIPTRADATDVQAAARIVPPITWTAQLTGGVHGMTVNGSLTYAM